MKKRAISNWIVMTLGIIAIFLICIAFFFYEFDSVVDLGIYKLFSNGINVVLDEGMYVFALIPILALIITVFLLKYHKRVAISFSRNNKDITSFVNGVIALLEIAILVICIVQIRKTSDVFESEKEIASVRIFALEEKTVIHAGGTVEYNGGLFTYTNSYEALVGCYNNGNRISEIDLLETSDGKFVCCHDDENGWGYGIDSDSALSEEAFLNKKLFGALTTMGMDQLVTFLRDHRDMYIVTDIKDENYKGCKFIADNYPDVMNQFIIQIYHMDEYDGIKELGFNNMIYTLYRTEAEERNKERLVSDIKSHDLVGVTFWYDWIETKDVYDNIKNIGIPIFVHTVNDKDDMIKCDSMKLLMYTDNTDNEWLR